MKLSKAQQRVMEWMSKGWDAEQRHGSAIYINGKRICNTDTMVALYKLGLVNRVSGQWIWKATIEGRGLSL